MKTKLAIFRAAAMAAILFLSGWLTAAQPSVGAEDLVACSPNQTHVAGVAADGRICYQRSSDGVVEHTFYICHAQALAFSEDGKLLAAAGGRNGSQGKIKVWRVSDRKQLCEIVMACEGARTTALVTDGNLVIVASLNGTIEAWSVTDGKRQWSRSISPTVQAIRFAPDGNGLLIQCADGTECLWDPAKGRNLLPAKATKQ